MGLRPSTLSPSTPPPTPTPSSFHNLSLSFFHSEQRFSAPSAKKDVVNQCLEFASLSLSFSLSLRLIDLLSITEYTYFFTYFQIICSRYKGDSSAAVKEEIQELLKGKVPRRGDRMLMPYGVCLVHVFMFGVFWLNPPHPPPLGGGGGL